MTLLAIPLILTAAVLHATWNFLAKSSRDAIAYFWWTVTLGTLGYGLYLMVSSGIYLAPASWLPFGISATAEIVYFATLMEGYKHGDLSLVYPISRGGAPLFLLLLNALLFGERLPTLGYIGIGLLVIGVYLVSLMALERRQLLAAGTLFAPFRNRAARMALVSAFFIAVYSLSDRFAVLATPPRVYNFWVYFGNSILWIPLVWTSDRMDRNVQELRGNWKLILVGSTITVVAYLAVLTGLTLTSASYVTAGRSISVVIGALLGTLVLKEGFGQMRVLGAVLMVAGLVLIAFA